MFKLATNGLLQLGRKASTYVKTPKFLMPNEVTPISTYQVMDSNGHVEDPSQIPISSEKMVEIFRNMTFLNVLDDILLESQRQGRLSFYMTNYGEEALVGMAEAFHIDDLISTQYRELGFLIQRGYSLQEIMNVSTSNIYDYSIGRQPNPSYFAKRLNIWINSAPLGTHVPQAAGQAYAMKMAGKKSCVVVFMGDGCSSEGDSFTGFNISATLASPVVFVCRNNQYAISTHSSEQYRGDAIAGRALAMGIPTIRVDGNDVFALINAGKAARQMAIETPTPVLIEAMSYRISHHSTSDDSAAYRGEGEMEEWKTTKSPFTRLRNYLTNNGLWDLETEKKYRSECFQNIVNRLKESEKMPKPGPDTIFSQLYSEVPKYFESERQQMMDHVKKHQHYYNS